MTTGTQIRIDILRRERALAIAELDSHRARYPLALQDTMPFEEFMSLKWKGIELINRVAETNTRLKQALRPERKALRGLTRKDTVAFQRTVLAEERQQSRPGVNTLHRVDADRSPQGTCLNDPD
ncbi:hypothetical protein KIPB_001031 [Kipferlia bialata]|uniref:Uncharacterized protein n=1 Tax=Kipferlia bialata TaxID=797122 RepID=A0A9K3CND9_9EUKA|nr:hypothetical protein KIPB_001031 [Kipferlia bialata]|eukprot:g1031.t1